MGPHDFGWNRTDVHEVVAKVVAIANGHGPAAVAPAMEAIQQELDRVGMTAALALVGARLLREAEDAGPQPPPPGVRRTLSGGATVGQGGYGHASRLAARPTTDED